MAALRSRYWRGRGARRSVPRRRPGPLRRLGRFAFGVVLLSMVALGSVQVLSSLAQSPSLRVHKLTVHRASSSLRSRLQGRMEHLLGAQLFDVDLSELARRLEEDPWVRRVVIKRWLPGTLRVTVQERRPAALAAFRGRTVLVDTQGWPIEAPLTDTGALPRLKGIRARDAQAFSEQAVAGLAALARVRRRAPELLEELTAVDLSVPGAVVLRRHRSPHEVWLNRVDAGLNLDTYARMRGELERRFGPLAAVDLRWKDQIALRPSAKRRRH
ncbi:MAG: FtsQ-type POTRA domain-containing protein [Acidobacteriota bacterium]